MTNRRCWYSWMIQWEKGSCHRHRNRGKEGKAERGAERAIAPNFYQSNDIYVGGRQQRCYSSWYFSCIVKKYLSKSLVLLSNHIGYLAQTTSDIVKNYHNLTYCLPVNTECSQIQFLIYSPLSSSDSVLGKSIFQGCLKRKCSNGITDTYIWEPGKSFFPDIVDLR